MVSLYPTKWLIFHAESLNIFMARRSCGKTHGIRIKGKLTPGIRREAGTAEGKRKETTERGGGDPHRTLLSAKEHSHEDSLKGSKAPHLDMEQEEH